MGILYCIGVPLSEDQRLTENSISALKTAKIVVGESRKITDRFLRQVERPEGSKDKPEVFQLDPFRKEEWQALEEAVRKLGADEVVALLSDTGMPILFDPGKDVLELCRKLKFTVRSTAGPTSWGMAAALSGFEPPFLVEGFLPRDNAERAKRLKELKGRRERIILMDTPYRFTNLLEQAVETFGDRRAFLAWEISKNDERLIWGTVKELVKSAKRAGLEKGEFIIVIG